MAIRYSRFTHKLTFLSDQLLLNLSILLGHFSVFNSFLFSYEYWVYLGMVNIIWLVFSITTQSFKFPRPLVLSDNINKFLVTLIYHLFTVFGIFYFFELFQISRLELLLTYSVFFLLEILYRSTLFFFLDYIRKKGYNHRQITIIGDELIAGKLLDSFSSHPEYGYDLVNIITQKDVFLLNWEGLKEKISRVLPDEIFICYKELNDDLLRELVSFGEKFSIKIKMVSDLILKNKYISFENNYDVPVLQVSNHPHTSLKIRILKRGFDLLFSILVLIFGFPVFLLLYIITKVTSKGPAFYKQERIGKNEKPFYIYKFRSMYVDAEKFGPQLSKCNDSRITPWGRIMRKSRLDELPQFWNVLIGDMSIVGPRPERQYFIEQILEKAPNYKKLLNLKPGITSIGQINYGYAENIDQMCIRLRYDLLYLQNISLRNDLKIIFGTVRVMFQGKGK